MVKEPGSVSSGRSILLLLRNADMKVMRAEGVLRLILNVSLYVGMSVLEDGKHVRSTVFEEKERRLVTFRVSRLSVFRPIGHRTKQFSYLCCNFTRLAPSQLAPKLTFSSDPKKQQRNFAQTSKIISP
jgi:Ran-binding protein 3